MGEIIKRCLLRHERDKCTVFLVKLTLTTIDNSITSQISDELAIVKKGGDCIELFEVLGTRILRTVCTIQPLVVGPGATLSNSDTLYHHHYCYQNHFVWSQNIFLHLNLLRPKCHSIASVGKLLPLALIHMI